jgi:hypothetical protein
MSVLVTAAVAVGVMVALTLVFGTTNGSPHHRHLARADTALCHSVANATPSSPAAFRLAEEISAQGSCSAA